MKVPIVVRLGVLASAAVVVAVVLGAVPLRSGETSTLPTSGATPTTAETCTGLSAATCQKVRAEILRFIGPGRQTVSMDIYPYYICLGNPFEPMSCPLPTGYLSSARVRLWDGEWAFTNVFETADGQLQTDGRILVPPAGWGYPSGIFGRRGEWGRPRGGGFGNPSGGRERAVELRLPGHHRQLEGGVPDA